MPSLPSPRLPGVNVLPPGASGPQYARWRRAVKTAFVGKETWGHCDGTAPMPMPESGPNFFTPMTAANPQPQLLEERRAWVKKDRDVKLDIFLSIADDIKFEVFEVGPPLPPSAISAKEMLEALDERFASFKFEDYHHVFCHFLNIHIDQYANIEEFNSEFSETLEELWDHGQPMSNEQACSAYFSKLRCTQNPWVAKKLKEWDTLSTEPKLKKLMKESPPWVVIRPLATKASSQQSAPECIPEENLQNSPPDSDTEEPLFENSDAATLSSKSSKSSHSRQSSQSTTHSQEITVHASYEDLTELDAFPSVPPGKLPAASIPKRLSSKSSKSKMSLSPPINRPLPALPPEAEAEKSNNESRSVSPNPSAKSAKSVSSSSSSSRTPQALEQVHPALRPSTPTRPGNLHPALRPSTSNGTSSPALQNHISAAMRPQTPNRTPPMKQSAFLSSSPNLNNLSPPKPNLDVRPSSSRSATAPKSQFDNSRPHLRRLESNSSSVISLPLQGATVPEFKDVAITEEPSSTRTQDIMKPSQSKLRIENLHTFRARSPSPPKTLAAKLHHEVSDDERKTRKRSWSIKARLSAKHGVKEII